LNVEAGDQLYLTPAHGVTLYDPEFEKQMTVARDMMRKDRDILRELAK